MIIIGIDPGQKGGVAILDSGRYIDAYPLPLQPAMDGRREKYIDSLSLHESLVSYSPTITCAYIEVQHVQGRQGGNLTIGANYGRLFAVLETLSIPYKAVNPRDWQGRMLQKQMYLVGGDTKLASIQYCIDRGYPVPMTSNRKNARPHDGVSDALCIAAYGWELARIEGMIIR